VQVKRKGVLEKNLWKEAVRGVHNTGKVALHFAKGNNGMHVEY
jgi:hypothetical protein